MSLAIYNALLGGGVFTSPAPTKGDRLMLTLWGILVSVCRTPQPQPQPGQPALVGVAVPCGRRPCVATGPSKRALPCLPPVPAT